ncbi:MAG: class I SAM-dependent methyltransferase [Thermoleophilaceae bacterium]|nr:class I SAM-dependent methyltransferase [Thermoleophilaceae bacterium]
MSRTRERLVLAARLTRQDPRVLGDYLGLSLRSRLGKDDGHERTAVPDSVTLNQALTRIGDWDRGPALERLAAFSVPRLSDARDATARQMASDDNLATLVYALVRAHRPRAVVETGVATGVTSAHALAALEDNGGGMLHSIDLPPRDLYASGAVAREIPSDLRGRWSYHLGASRRLLPAVLERTTGGTRIFLHDSDHGYVNMRWELAAAWRALAPGDWILADDVNLHDAFADFAAEAGDPAWYVDQSTQGGLTGVLRKGGASRLSA